MISTLLLSTTSLKCLSLAKNRVGAKSMISLGNALSSSVCPLRKLVWVSLPLTPWLHRICDAPEVGGTGECFYRMRMVAMASWECPDVGTYKKPPFIQSWQPFCWKGAEWVSVKDLCLNKAVLQCDTYMSQVGSHLTPRVIVIHSFSDQWLPSWLPKPKAEHVHGWHSYIVKIPNRV